MGGFGSGQWMTRDARSTVEQSFVLSISSLRQAIRPGAYGWITWDWPNGAKSSVGLSVTQDADTPIITLQYRCRNHEDIRIPVRLQATSINSGGKRWWFTCPLIVDGVRCGRRAGKLYLPPGARYFGCRKCHDLTYRSSQEAHQRERLLATIQRQTGWRATSPP